MNKDIEWTQVRARKLRVFGSILRLLVARNDGLSKDRVPVRIINLAITLDTGATGRKQCAIIDLDPRSFLLPRGLDVGFLLRQRHPYRPLKQRCSGQPPRVDAYGGSLTLPSPRPRLDSWHGRTRPGLQTSLIGSRHGGEGGAPVSGGADSHTTGHAPATVPGQGTSGARVSLSRDSFSTLFPAHAFAFTRLVPIFPSRAPCLLAVDSRR
ncbi:hypothetical protein IWX90DRAFT_313935 [Phyllosticta citrichinensis]|uniref:Uncharacterized protein n=1 Tax=Phyllosticta citrichinensis TaxID=1130410 RepID=A0ABR1XIW2_9PEZI